MRRPTAPTASGRLTLVLAVALLASCSSADGSGSATTRSSTVAIATDGATIEATAPTDDPPSTVAMTIVDTTDVETTDVDTTVVDTTHVDTTAPTTTAASIPTTSTTTPISVTTADLDAVDGSIVIGTSVEGRPITAARRGTPGGRRVLIFGVIHGDENAGTAIVDRLNAFDVPDGVDLWLIEAMNPDGLAHDVRQNANRVDLNRNFPYNWGPIGEPGNWEYAGPGPASEPETRAVVGFVTALQPDITIWYHQDYDRIAPGQGRDGAIRARYSELTGVPLLSITGGTYTGVAATWARRTLAPGVAFIVELGPTLSDEQADAHAAAVLTIAADPGL